MFNLKITDSLWDQAFQTNTVFVEPGTMPPRDNIASIGGYYCRLACDPSVQEGCIAMSRHQRRFLSNGSDDDLVNVDMCPSLAQRFTIVSTGLTSVTVSVVVTDELRGSAVADPSAYLNEIRENFLGAIFQKGQIHTFESKTSGVCTLEITNVTTKKIECGDYNGDCFRDGGRFTEASTLLFSE